MKLYRIILPALALLLIAGSLDAGPKTGTFQISMPGYSTQIFVTVPSNYKTSQSGKWGLIVGLHGSGQPAGSYLGAWSLRSLGSAGYIMVSPQSCTGAGVWNIDGAGDNAKECEYILKIVEKLMKDYDLNPDMIHVNGFSAGSAMCAVGVAGDGSFRKFKQKSFVGFSGGFSGAMSANGDKAKETKVRVYNGKGDAGHKEPSRHMYQAFKDAGYDAEYFEVAGGHSYPLVNHNDILKWYMELDKVSRKKGEYIKLASQAEKALKDKKYSDAKSKFEKLMKDAGEELTDLAEKAKKGLEEIAAAEAAALKKIEELKAAGNAEDLAGYCKQAMKDFDGTKVEDAAKAALKGIGRKPSGKVEKAANKPDEKNAEPEIPEPEKETAAGLLARAKRCVEAEAYQAAARYLEKIIRNYPDAPESKEAQRLRDEIEDEL